MTVYSHNANCLTPIMTADNAPSPVVISASSVGISAAAWKAFDQVGSGNGWATTASTGWLKVYSGAGPWIVSSYTIVPTYYTGTLSAAPRTWTLQGSNDDSSWTTIDTQTGVVFSSTSDMKTFSFSNDTGYTYHKIDITDNYGSGGYLGIAELELIGILGPTHFGDAAESSESTDTVDGYRIVTSDVSESSTTTDDVLGTKDSEIADVAESSAGTDAVVGYQDYSIGDVAEASESTDSTTATSTMDADVSEASSSSDTVVCYTHDIVDVIESSSSSDTISAVVTSIDDRTGAFSTTAAFPSVLITGSIGNIGSLILESEFFDFTSIGASGIVGNCVCTAEEANFSSIGFVDNIGTAELLAQFSQFAGTGITDNIGAFAVSTQFPVFNAAGIQDVIGTASFVSEFSEFYALGIVNCIGRLAAVSQLPTILFSGEYATILAYCFDLIKKSLISTFTNYGFNSFAVINGLPVGSSSSGLFSLLGSTDNGTVISSTITFPLGKFGVSNEKQLRAVKLFGRTSGSLTITALDGKGNSWAVAVDGNEDLTAETLLGYFPFTARGRYLQIKVENNAGCDFLLDQVNLSLYNLGRM